jgi:hypothetical protein
MRYPLQGLHLLRQRPSLRQAKRSHRLPTRRQLRIGAVLATTCFISVLMYSHPAFASTPVGLLSPGSYSISDWENGKSPVSGSLDVQNSNYYTQTLNVASGQIELWLTQPVGSFAIYLQQIYIGGLFFTSNGQGLPSNPPPVLYRPYVAPGVLQAESWNFVPDNQTGCPPGVCYLHSTAGGVTLYDTSTSTIDRYYHTASGYVLIQKIESTLTLGGNGSGTIDVVQFETPGSPNKALTSYVSVGALTVLGSSVVINTAASLGGLE